MIKMTEDNCRIGDPKVMTNTKGAPNFVNNPYSQNILFRITPIPIFLFISVLNELVPLIHHIHPTSQMDFKTTNLTRHHHSHKLINYNDNYNSLV